MVVFIFIPLPKPYRLEAFIFKKKEHFYRHDFNNEMACSICPGGNCIYSTPFFIFTVGVSTSSLPLEEFECIHISVYSIEVLSS